MNYFKVNIDKVVLDWVNNIVKYYITEITNEVRSNHFEAKNIRNYYLKTHFFDYRIIVDFFIPESITPDGTYFIMFSLYKIDEIDEVYIHSILTLKEERLLKLKEIEC